MYLTKSTPRGALLLCSILLQSFPSVWTGGEIASEKARQFTTETLALQSLSEREPVKSNSALFYSVKSSERRVVERKPDNMRRPRGKHVGWFYVEQNKIDNFCRFWK